MAQSEQNPAGPVEIDEVDEWSVVEGQNTFVTRFDDQAGISASTRLAALVSHASHATTRVLNLYRRECNPELLFL